MNLKSTLKLFLVLILLNASDCIAQELYKYKIDFATQLSDQNETTVTSLLKGFSKSGNPQYNKIENSVIFESSVLINLINLKGKFEKLQINVINIKQLTENQTTSENQEQKVIPVNYQEILDKAAKSQQKKNLNSNQQPNKRF